MNLEFTNGVARLTLSEPRELEVIKLAAVTYADRLAEAELANRNYHMGTRPTPGRNYDDRLTIRLGFSATTCYEYLRLDAKRGGLAGRQVGTKWLITEEAVRDFEGRRKQKQAA